MTVFFDEGVPEALKFRLRGHFVESVKSRGWFGIQNGSLLKLIGQAGFEVFITADKNLSYQQPVAQLPFAMLVLSTNHWPTVKKNAQAVRDALEAIAPREIVFVDCGLFTPMRKRDRSGS